MFQPIHWPNRQPMFQRSSLALLAALGGCASPPAGPLSLSLNDLGSEVKVDAGSLFGGLSHRRSHNITGMGAADTVGELTADPDPPLLFELPNLFSRDNLPDQLALRISPRCSQVVVQDLAGESPVSLPDVLALRDQIQTLETSAFALLKYQAEQALVQAITVAAKAAEAAASAAAAAVASPAAPPAAAAASAAPSADAAVRSRDATTQQERIAAWRTLNPQTPLPDDAAGWQAHADALGERVAVARETLRAAEQEASRLRAKPGLVVARWDHAKSRQSGWDAVGLAGSQRSAQHRIGFVVLGAPRTMTLAVGDDLQVRACSSDGAQCRPAPGTEAVDGEGRDRRSGMDSSVKPRRLYTTSFQLLARHVAWSESGQFEEEQAFAMKLDELIKGVSAATSPALVARLSALKLSFSSARATRASATNTGAISAGKTTVLPFSFDGDDQYRQSIDFIRKQRDGYLTVSSMRSTLDAYARTQGNVKPREPDACRRDWNAFAQGQGLPGGVVRQAEATVP